MSHHLHVFVQAFHVNVSYVFRKYTNYFSLHVRHRLHTFVQASRNTIFDFFADVRRLHNGRHKRIFVQAVYKTFNIFWLILLMF